MRSRGKTRHSRQSYRLAHLYRIAHFDEGFSVLQMDVLGVQSRMRVVHGDEVGKISVFAIWTTNVIILNHTNNQSIVGDTDGVSYMKTEIQGIARIFGVMRVFSKVTLDDSIPPIVEVGKADFYFFTTSRFGSPIDDRVLILVRTISVESSGTSQMVL